MTFNVGDKVQIIKGTLLWGANQDLKDKVGVVTDLVDDGTSITRITVEYDGIERFTGIAADQFTIAN